MDAFIHQLAELALAIEAEMRRLGLWQGASPSPQALASLSPFCHDTLTLEQWLQWQFLPKIKQVIEGEAECPSSSDITPLAEHRFAQLPQQTDQLLRLIEQFDRCINREALGRPPGDFTP